MSVSLTRNFCIIAHIDHGKTTLSDRLLEVTNTIANRDKQEQVLDSMELERERGITIKSHPVSMQYRAKDGKEYTLNLMDTPGHVDFTYEVSRSLAACEGAILIVDAAQGVEAQTMANIHLANKQGLAIIPVINKIDLPNADLPSVRKQLEDLLAIPSEEAIPASAKAGIGIEEILEAVVQRIPPPPSGDGVLRALVFDSLFDTYRGVVSYIRVFSGDLKAGTQVKLMSTNQNYEVKEVGIFTPTMTSTPSMTAGDVGYFIGNIKSTAEIKIGDTLTDSKKPAAEPLPGFKEVQPMVFSGIYPINTADFEQLKTAMGKLQINDAAFNYMPESSVALGFGFRCGFLGLLHMEIIVERLRREYDMDIIATYPSVVYEVVKTNGEVLMVDNPANLPDMSLSIEDRSAFESTSPQAASRSERDASGPSGRSAFIGEENFGESTPLPRDSEIFASECLILLAAPAVGTHTSVPERSNGPGAFPSRRAPATWSAKDPALVRKRVRGLDMGNGERLGKQTYQGNLVLERPTPREDRGVFRGEKSCGGL